MSGPTLGSMPWAALALACLAGPLGARAVHAQPAHPSAAPRHELSAELLAGTAWSLRTPLTVQLPGEASTTQRARYSTRPFADAPYYAYRVGYGSPSRGVEAELVHHKLYLENPAPPIERFEVTHGYNLATANVRAPAGRYLLRAGLGVVVAHAEGRIAGRAVGGERRTLLGGGYHIAGATMQLAVGRRYPFGRGAVAAYAMPELKLTASTARVPLTGGSVSVPNVALHLLGGLGVRRRW